MTQLLRDTDNNDFQSWRYDAGLSWNGLYEFLSTEHRAVRLGFDPTKFGPYNTAPTRQTLTTAWDVDLSDAAKRTLLSVSERLVDTAYENDAALDLRPPRHVEDTDSDLRERHIGTFSNDQIRQTVRLARETIFSAFDSEIGRAHV